MVTVRVIRCTARGGGRDGAITLLPVWTVLPVWRHKSSRLVDELVDAAKMCRKIICPIQVTRRSLALQMARRLSATELEH